MTQPLGICRRGRIAAPYCHVNPFQGSFLPECSRSTRNNALRIKSYCVHRPTLVEYSFCRLNIWIQMQAVYLQGRQNLARMAFTEGIPEVDGPPRSFS